MKGKKDFELCYELIKREGENKENQTIDTSSNQYPNNNLTTESSIDERSNFSKMGFPKTESIEEFDVVNSNLRLVEFSPSLVISKKDDMVHIQTLSSLFISPPIFSQGKCYRNQQYPNDFFWFWKGFDFEYTDPANQS